MAYFLPFLCNLTDLVPFTPSPLRLYANQVQSAGATKRRLACGDFVAKWKHSVAPIPEYGKFPGNKTPPAGLCWRGVDSKTETESINMPSKHRIPSKRTVSYDHRSKAQNNPLQATSLTKSSSEGVGHKPQDAPSLGATSTPPAWPSPGPIGIDSRQSSGGGSLKKTRITLSAENHQTLHAGARRESLSVSQYVHNLIVRDLAAWRSEKLTLAK
jgi:hypothetical protein